VSADSNYDVDLGPLTPELALVDPELASRARDRLPVNGASLSFQERAPSPRQVAEVAGLSGHPRDADARGDESANGFMRNGPDFAGTVVRPRTAIAGASTMPARSSLGQGASSVEAEPATRVGRRWRKRVVLAALGILAGVVGFLALAADLTSRETTRSHALPNAAKPVDSRVAPRAVTTKQPKSSTGGRAKPRGAKQPTRASSPGVKSKAAKRPKSSIGRGATAKASRRPVVPSPRVKTRSTNPSAFPARDFIWPAVANASFYEVKFFRRGKEIFKALTSKPRLKLPLRWVYRGRTFRLKPGAYSWRVSPAFGPRSRLRYGKPIIQSTWVAQR
jgi:hypothetical protein